MNTGRGDAYLNSRNFSKAWRTRDIVKFKDTNGIRYILADKETNMYYYQIPRGSRNHPDNSAIITDDLNKNNYEIVKIEVMFPGSIEVEGHSGSFLTGIVYLNPF